MSSRRARLLALAACALWAGATRGGEPGDAAIARGDAAWERRAEGHEGSRGAIPPIAAAIAAYDEALAAAPESGEARWKIMRALFFHGEYVAVDRDEQLAIFERGRLLGEAGIDAIAARVGGRERLWKATADDLRAAVPDPTEAAEILFWSAAHTGVWGRTRGKLASARQGVAGRIRDYAAASMKLDPEIENGGGHRVLGRLHTEAPKIPFITGWIDRETAIAQLEACFAIAPHDLTTRLYLGEALAEFVPQRKEEGLRMLRELVTVTPNPEWLVEELKAIADARAVLLRLAS
ncbi:MAG: hypothetical protein OES32_15555 [Acidobacteriota bacterium]|nr:hypothetical protein [Acidobacteriota bacterium]MDH3524996.1 hypothetical protein [Acidobacteriota bacterium]